MAYRVSERTGQIMQHTKTVSSPDEAMAAFREALARGGVEIVVTMNSDQQLSEMRTKLGGKISQSTVGEWRWVLKGYDAADVLATTYALRALYRQGAHMLLPPMAAAQLRP